MTKNFLFTVSLILMIVALLAMGCQKEEITETQSSESKVIYKKDQAPKIFEMPAELESKSDEIRIKGLKKALKSNKLLSAGRAGCGPESYFEGPIGACYAVPFGDFFGRQCAGCGIGICNWFYSYYAYFYDCNYNYIGIGIYWCESSETCTCGETLNGGYDTKIIQDISLFVSRELGEKGTGIIELYIRHEKEINHILESQDPGYKTVQLAFDRFLNTTKELIEQGFDTSDKVIIDQTHISAASDFLKEFKKLAKNQELKTAIEGLQSELHLMEGKELKKALKEMD